MGIDKETLAKVEQARLAYLESLQPKRPGKDWFTTEEYAAECKDMTNKGAHLRLSAMHKAGFIEQQRVGRRAYWRAKP